MNQSEKKNHIKLFKSGWALGPSIFSGGRLRSLNFYNQRLILTYLYVTKFS